MKKPKGSLDSSSGGIFSSPQLPAGNGHKPTRKSKNLNLILLPALKLKKPSFRTPKTSHIFGNKWSRFWFRHPRAKRVSLFSATLLVVLVGILALRLLIAANQIIDGGNSAVALGENIDPNLLGQEGDGRVNVLLIGVGGPDHTGGDLSDSIMVASLDPITHDLAMISIPRDLYVPMPGFGSAKINAAHAYGEQYQYDGGGPQLLSDTITQLFGIPIHYYLRVDFDGFQDAIDVVGGVDVYVAKAIEDYTYPDENLSGYEPFSLPAGQQHLDSSLALKYVRSRHGSSDFERAERQQNLLLALKDKILSAGTFLDPIKLNGLVSVASGHVRTNLSIDDGRKLLELLQKVDTSSVKRTNLINNIQPSLLVDRVINGAWVVVPTAGSFEGIQLYIRQLLPDGYIKNEAAQIKIVNASGRSGLARQTADLLKSYGYTITGIETGTQISGSEIIDYTGTKPYTLHYLKKRFKVEPRLEAKSAQQVEDITIILGTDYENSPH